MGDREALVRTIAECWDDATPVLGYADWAEEYGTRDPELLRWYAREVLPAVAAVPPDLPRVTDSVLGRATRTLRPHPQAELLRVFAAVACCRRPDVWGGLTSDLTREAVAVTRLFALGLATAADRRAVHRRILLEYQAADGHMRAPGRESQQGQTHTDRERVHEALGPVTRLWFELNYAAQFADAGYWAAAVHLMARAEAERGPVRRVAGHAKGYQAAVAVALAAVHQCLDAPRVVGADRPSRLRTHDTPPGSRFVIPLDGRDFACDVVCVRVPEPGLPPERAFHPDYVAARAASGQRLVVRFGYTVWHFVGGRARYPGRDAVLRMIHDARAAGWRPSTPGLADFEVDGRAYLSPAGETVFG